MELPGLRENEVLCFYSSLKWLEVCPSLPRNTNRVNHAQKLIPGIMKTCA